MTIITMIMMMIMTMIIVIFDIFIIILFTTIIIVIIMIVIIVIITMIVIVMMIRAPASKNNTHDWSLVVDHECRRSARPDAGHRQLRPPGKRAPCHEMSKLGVNSLIRIS